LLPGKNEKRSCSIETVEKVAGDGQLTDKTGGSQGLTRKNRGKKVGLLLKNISQRIIKKREWREIVGCREAFCLTGAGRGGKSEKYGKRSKLPPFRHEIEGVSEKRSAQYCRAGLDLPERNRPVNFGKNWPDGV